MEPLILRYVAERGAFIPIVVSLWYFVRLWRDGELFGKAALIFGGWWILATVLQLSASGPGWWVTGLVAQVALAIVLVLKLRMSDIV